jgi:hypothetical protein
MLVYLVASLVLSCDGGHTATVRHSFGRHHASDSGSTGAALHLRFTLSLAVQCNALAAKPLLATMASFVCYCARSHGHGHTLVCLGATLVRLAIAHDTGRDPINVRVLSFFLTVFCESQLVAENLDAVKIGFGRDNRGRAIDLCEQRALCIGERDEIGRKATNVVVTKASRSCPLFTRSTIAEFCDNLIFTSLFAASREGNDPARLGTTSKFWE